MSSRPRLAGWRATGIAAGMVADRLLGEPPGTLHPVAWFGTAMEALEGRWWADDVRAGVGYTAVGTSLGVAGGVLVDHAVRALLRGRAAVVAPAVAASVAVGTCAAGRALTDAAISVRRELQTGDLGAARTALGSLVGRDVEELDETGVARAVVESVAENTVDAVIAPIWWALVAGPVGVTAHRAVNTLDAMVGYRTDHYRRFGWASARLDDAVNWIPARVTALAVAACRPRAAGDVWRAVRHDAPAHPSPNAGVAEAAFAAALGLRLGGPTVYGGITERRPELGGGRPAVPTDIDRAAILSRQVTVVTVAAALGATAGVSAAVAGRRRRGAGAQGDARARSPEPVHDSGLVHDAVAVRAR